MTISCIVVEDEPLARNLLTEYINKVPVLKLVKSCSDSMEAIETLNSAKVDLMFLDVQMPELSGISLLHILQKKPLVVLTTAYSEYAIEGYELDVVDYLLKPITMERFLKAIDKVGQRLQHSPSGYDHSKENNDTKKRFVFVKDGNKLVRLQWDDILYIEGLKDYVIIHTPRQKVVTLQRLKSLEEQLPQNEFIRVHNSYIISLKKIDSILKDQVQIGEVMIPVGDTYRKSFRDYVNKNHLN